MDFGLHFVFPFLQLLFINVAIVHCSVFEVFLKVLLVLKSEVWHFAVKIPRMLLLVLESTCLPCSLGLMFTSAAGKSPEFRPRNLEDFTQMQHERLTPGESTESRAPRTNQAKWKQQEHEVLTRWLGSSSTVGERTHLICSPSAKAKTKRKSHSARKFC